MIEYYIDIPSTKDVVPVEYVETIQKWVVQDAAYGFIEKHGAEKHAAMIEHVMAQVQERIVGGLFDGIQWELVMP